MVKGAAVSYRWHLDDEDKGSNASLQLPFTKSGRQTVVLEATDQFGNIGRSTVTFAVAPNQPPQLVLASTPDRAVTTGERVTLNATVTDVENKYNSVEWKLDGNPVPVAWLSGDKAQVLTFPTADSSNPTAKVGTYMVTAQVSDNIGQGASDVATVVVQAPQAVALANQSPLVQIDWPRPGDTVYAGDATPLTVAVADTEAGKLKVTWLVNGTTVSGEGTVAAGKVFVQVKSTYTFPQAGSYPITVRVADEAGGQQEAMVTVQVQSKQTGEAVNAQILKPLPNAFLSSGVAVEFEAVNVPAGSTVEWKSDRDGSLGKVATLTKALTTEGAHRIALLVDGKEADYRNLTVAGNVDVRQIIGTVYQPNTACTIWHGPNTSEAMSSGKVYDIVEGDFVDCGSATVQINLKSGGTVTASTYPAPYGTLRVTPQSGTAGDLFQFSAENVVGHNIRFGIKYPPFASDTVDEWFAGSSANLASYPPSGVVIIVLEVNGLKVDRVSVQVDNPCYYGICNQQIPGRSSRPPEKIQEELQKAGVKDVAPDHFAANSLTVLLQAGLLTPDANGHLNPEDPVTVGEGVAIFAKVLGIASKQDDVATAFAKARDAGREGGVERPNGCD
jgi:hypothetical protein